MNQIKMSRDGLNGLGECTGNPKVGLRAKTPRSKVLILKVFLFKVYVYWERAENSLEISM